MPLERVLDALGVPGRDQGPGHRRPAERVVAGEIERLDLARRRRCPRRAGAAAWRSKRARRAARWPAERRLERLVVGIHAQPEHVQLAARDLEAEAARDGVDLDAGDEVEAGRDAAPAATSR